MEIIVGKTAGFCNGVKRAVEGSLEQIDVNQDKAIYCLGELVHNKEVVSELKEKGIKFIDEINEAQENSKVIIRAHGVKKEIYESANEMNIEVIDYTCPNVARIHKIAEKYHNDNYYIFLTGTENHPEVIGITSYCGKEYTVIDSENDVEKALDNLRKSNMKKLLLISQTTYSVKKFETIKEKIEKEKPENVELFIKNTICLATEQRQRETKELAKKVDMMIIIGGRNSSNTKKLYEVAKECCKNTICIENKDEINEKINVDKLGIMAGASTPKKSIQEVIEAVTNPCIS